MRRVLSGLVLALAIAGVGSCGRTSLDPGPSPPSELITTRPIPPHPLPSDPFPPGPALVRFAVIGDYGLDSEPEARVARMVAGWRPDFVITTGDNNYPLGEASTIDANIGKHYARFIGNYRGAFGPGSATNRFWPSPGNHDWDTGTLAPYLDYFTLPGNGRYYDVVVGPVHLFALDSDPREPDGMTEDSVQARWLEATMTASSACFQVAYFHHPAYSSSMHGSTVAMRWPFESWGADAIFAGHDHVYERSRSGGIRHFTVGTSGAEAYGFSTPLPESEARFAGERGALLVTVREDGMWFQFFADDGREIDSFALYKACPQ
jgi:tartrate-resistant acid phosphatase type 5